MDKCSQETTSTAQEDSQPEPLKQDQQERSAWEEGSLWPDASVSCSRSQSHSRSPANKHKSEDKKKDSSSWTADMNTVKATEMTTGLHINPERDQGAGLTLDIKGVTPDAEAIPEVLLIHVLQEDITPAGSPGHNLEPDPSPSLGLTGEDQGLVLMPANQDQNQGQDQRRHSHRSRSHSDSRSPDHKGSKQNSESPQKEH